MKIVLFNTGDARAEGTFAVTAPDGGLLKSLPLNLPPHHQRVINLSEIVRRGREMFGGISISHEGGPGGVMAQAYLYDSETGLSLNLPLYDPGTAGDSVLAGAGVRLGADASNGERYSGRLLLRNLSMDAIQATATLQRGVLPRAADAIMLQPGETRVVEFDSSFLPESGEPAGIRIAHTGKPGDLVGYWFSLSASGAVAARTPLESVPPTWHRGGNSPWHLEGGLSAVQYVLNVGAEDASFKARIMTGDTIYSISPRPCRPARRSPLTFAYSEISR
jgi:hypothetical protein